MVLEDVAANCAQKVNGEVTIRHGDDEFLGDRAIAEQVARDAECGKGGPRSRSKSQDAKRGAVFGLQGRLTDAARLVEWPEPGLEVLEQLFCTRSPVSLHLLQSLIGLRQFNVSFARSA